MNAYQSFISLAWAACTLLGPRQRSKTSDMTESIPGREDMFGTRKHMADMCGGGGPLLLDTAPSRPDSRTGCLGVRLDPLMTGKSGWLSMEVATWEAGGGVKTCREDAEPRQVFSLCDVAKCLRSTRGSMVVFPGGVCMPVCIDVCMYCTF